jgi:Protein of unknown function (DUF3292)
MTTPLASNWRQQTENANIGNQGEVADLSSLRDLQSGPPNIDNLPPLNETASSSDAGANNLPAVTETTAPLESAPTDSHALATQDHEEKGASQVVHGDAEVKDLGWDENPKHIPAPLVGGLPNEELWTLVRRFNKVYPL